MRIFTFISLLSLVACFDEEKVETNDTGLDTAEDVEDTGGSEDTDDTEDTEEDTEETDTEDTETEDPAVVLEEGNWDIEVPTIVSDTCSLDTYQDVKEFVPASIRISNSTESSFMLDSETECLINDDSFICDPQNFEESVILGTATMIISNTMSGEINNSGNIDIEFAVVVEECQGFGCAAPELVITFPCPVTLDTSASK